MPDEIRIISTAGCDLTRLTDILVKNMPKIQNKCRLFLVGGGTEKDISTIRAICYKNNINNVEIVGKLNQNDLKAIIGYCHIGIVSYHQQDLNNKYCASGKIFEFLFEGLPVVTTTNPPLQSFCKEHGVGESSDEFYDGINLVIANYSLYREKVQAFINGYLISENNAKLCSNIKSML